MRFCPNCGTQSDDHAMFCGECGFSFANAPQQQAAAAAPQMQQQTYTAPQQQGYTAPQQPAYETPQQQAYGAPQQQPYTVPQQPAYGAPQQQEKQKSKLPLIIGIAVAAVCLIAIGAFAIAKLAGGGGGGQKSADFVGAQQAFLEERAEAYTASVAKDTFSTDMTVSVDLNGSGEYADLLSGILDDSAILMKIDNTAKKSVLNAALLLKGSNVLEAFLSVTPDQIAFSVPNANDDLYVMDMEALMELAGGAYDPSFFEQDPAKMRNELKELADRYIGVFASSINKEHILTESRDVKLSEVGKTVKCTVMTWTPDEDELIGLCDALADTLEEDDQLISLLDAYGIAADTYTYADMDGAQMVQEMADSLRDDAEDFAESMVDLDFSWTVALDSKNNVSWIRVGTTEGEIALERAVDADGGAEALYATSDGYDMFFLSNEYKANGQKRTGELTVETPEGKIGLDYDIDLAQKSVIGVPYGTYTADLFNVVPGIDLSLTVSDGGKNSTDHILSVDGLAGFTDNMLSDVTLTVNTTDKSSAEEPSGREKDISGYDEDELEELFTGLVYDIGSSMMQSPEIGDLINALGGGF